MPVPTTLIGSTVGPLTHEVDARWTMAHAASLDRFDDCYLDTTQDAGVVAHPLFSVCPEWPVIVRSRDDSLSLGVSADDVRRSVHATHDVVIHRLVEPGDVLHTSMTIVGLEQRPPGAYATMRLETVDAAGRPVATTEQGSLYLGVDVDRADQPAASTLEALELPPVSDSLRSSRQIPISAGAAHTYTECARIWNPIHTDAAVAEAAGLPAIILHGTATLAHGVSVVVDEEADGDPRLVRRVSGRFRSMVFMPSTITVRVTGRAELGGGRDAVRFEVLTEQGSPAVDAGVVVLGSP